MNPDPRDMTVDREVYTTLKRIEARFDELATKYSELATKYSELADKYAAALGREAELKERVRILIKRFEGQG